MLNDFTLVLTKGMHTISAAVAEQILAAMKEGNTVVDVELDLFGGGKSSRRTILATAHVVALTMNPPEPTLTSGAVATNGNVATLRRRR